MLTVKTNGIITNDQIIDYSPKAIEDHIADTISKGVLDGIRKNIENLPFINIEQTSEQDASVSWDSELIICSNEQIIDIIKEVSTRLIVRAKISADDIEYCLEPLTLEG